MSDSRSLTPVELSEYELIEAAMTESARGRRFLAEYARRNRNADTDTLLAAIGRLETAVTGGREDGDVGRLHGDLMEMAEAIARTKAEISALSAPDQDQSRLGVASEALDAIVRATERATSDILSAAEEVQEAAWTLRETGAQPELCDELDRRATQIYTACSFQDLTAQRTSRIVHTLRYLEDRIASMIAIWGRRIDDVPAPPGETVLRMVAPAVDLCQSDVDRFLEDDLQAAHEPSTPVPLATALTLHDDLAFLPDETPAEPEAAASDEIALSGEDDRAVAREVPPAETMPTDRDDTASARSPDENDLALAFTDLDSLSIEEKIALFS